MAPKRVSELPAATSGDLDDTDELLAVDAATSKRVALAALRTWLATLFASRTPPVGAGLATTGAVELDMAALNDTYQAITLTGNATFSTINRAAGRAVTVKLSAGASTRTLAWPAWIPLGSALPTSLAAGKVLVFTVAMFDGTDAAAVASAAVQP